MVCLGLEPGAAGWKAQTNPLSYGGTPKSLDSLSLQLAFKYLRKLPSPIFSLTIYFSFVLGHLNSLSLSWTQKLQ